MPRHLLKFLLLGLLFLFVALPAGSAQAAEKIVVRIPIEEGVKQNRAVIQAERVIDYGSFLWAVMDGQDLIELETSGTEYQTVENPYTLTLGGQSFDPLVSRPNFSAALSTKGQSTDNAGMHLVQFYGPTRDEWLDDLEAAGLEIIQYIHPFTYVVWGETTSLTQSRAQDTVRWAGDFLAAYAVLPENRTLNSDPILVRTAILPQAGSEKTIAEIEGLGGTLLSSSSGVDPTFDLATFLLPGNLLSTAAGLTGVYSISPVPLDGGDRGEMSSLINIGNYSGMNTAYTSYENWLDSVELSGDGVIISAVDSGIDQTHPDLVNRIISCTGTTCSSHIGNHGTHTAGIMAGDGSSGVLDAFGFLRGLGMAPGANLIVQDYYPTYTYEDGMLTLMTESYQNGAVVSGNSWGPSGTPQGYDEDTRLVDVGVRDADPGTEGNQQLSYILSFMNGSGGTSSQGSPDEAKNVFTIGSTYMQQTGSGEQYPNINDLSHNTAHGPALDGRTIPHLVAPGCDVDSTVAGSSHGLMCGTSMASPQVTGSVALFIEYYRQLFSADPSPALVKAAFLPVAYDLAGNLDADGGTLGHPFDSKQGWGRLNTNAVVKPSANTTVIYIDQETLFDNTGETWVLPVTDLIQHYNIQAMLVWTDAPGHGLGGDTDAWVNNLDLSLTVGSDTYYGNNFGEDGLSITGGSPDGMNNTEGIFLELQSESTITFTVTAADISGDGVPNTGDETDQDFALVIYISENTSVFPVFFR